MSTVKTTFTSDDKDIQTALQRMVNETHRLREANRKLANESRTGAAQSQAAFASQSQELTRMAAQLTSVAAGVATARKLYSDWAGDMDRLAASSRDFHRDLMKNLAEAGLALQAPRVKEFLESIPGATRDEAAAAFFGVAGGAPRLGLEEQESLAREVARQAPITDEAGLQRLGEFAGRLQRISPEKTADDVVDMAVKLMDDAGKDIDKVSSPGFLRTLPMMRELGFSVEQAMALAVETLHQDMRPDVLTQMAVKASERIEPAERGRHQDLEPHDELRNRLAQMSPRARFDLMLANEDVAEFFFGGQGIKLSGIRPEAVAATTVALEEAQREDFARRNVEALEGFRPEIQREREAQVRRESLELRREQQAEARAARIAEDEELIEELAGGNAFKRFGFRVVAGAERFLEDMLGESPARTQARIERAEAEFNRERLNVGGFELVTGPADERPRAAVQPIEDPPAGEPARPAAAPRPAGFFDRLGAWMDANPLPGTPAARAEAASATRDEGLMHENNELLREQNELIRAQGRQSAAVAALRIHGE